MPSTSKRQHDLMQAVAHNPKFAATMKIPQSVGEDFVDADKSAHKYESTKKKTKKRYKPS